MTFVVEEVPRPPPELRRAYLASLGEPQELYVEGLVAKGRTLLLCDEGRVVGYAVVEGATIVEFLPPGVDAGRSARAFERVLRGAPASRALAKTFDAPMLAAALSQPARARPLGHLFRALRPLGPPTRDGVVVRAARRSDVDAVLTMHDGFFDEAGEIEAYIADGGLLLYFSPGGDLTACGLSRRVIRGRDDIDIGMVVAPAHRGRGIGAFVAAHGAWVCLGMGARPIAGCSVDNPASRRALLRAGFIETHALIEFDYGAAT